MGPWPGDHGNRRKEIDIISCRQLQWGRGLVTTEIDSHFADRLAFIVLQWGRGLVTTEIQWLV